jgi:hypothetical protein
MEPDDHHAPARAARVRPSEIHWLTTWTTNADRLLAEPMGLPRGLKIHARADTGEWLAAHPHVLVVAPDLFAGLTHEQLDEIEAWWL